MTDPLAELRDDFPAPTFVAWPHCLNNPSGWAIAKDEALTRIVSGLRQIEDQLRGDRECEQADRLRVAAAHVEAAADFYGPTELGDPNGF